MDRTTKAIEELLSTVRILRSPGGCNWDREQTLQSLRPYMLEEAYEVADSVDNNDMDELKKELGDLLLHIVMAADICNDDGFFDLADVAGQITEKLRRRHPHVFNKGSDLTPEEVEKQWESIKSAEKTKEKKKFFDSLPKAMPSLQKAWRIQQRASDVGFPGKTQEENAQEVIRLLNTCELTEEAIGIILFALADIARQNRVEPEKALRDKNRDFVDRFNHLEELLASKGCSLDSKDNEVLLDVFAIAFES